MNYLNKSLKNIEANILNVPLKEGSKITGIEGTIEESLSGKRVCENQNAGKGEINEIKEVQKGVIDVTKCFYEVNKEDKSIVLYIDSASLTWKENKKVISRNLKGIKLTLNKDGYFKSESGNTKIKKFKLSLKNSKIIFNKTIKERSKEVPKIISAVVIAVIATLVLSSCKTSISAQNGVNLTQSKKNFKTITIQNDDTLYSLLTQNYNIKVGTQLDDDKYLHFTNLKENDILTIRKESNVIKITKNNKILNLIMENEYILYILMSD